MTIADNILLVAVGVLLGLAISWVYHRFLVFEYKLEQRASEAKNTNAYGQDCDPDGEDVRGNIGFNNKGDK